MSEQERRVPGLFITPEQEEESRRKRVDAQELMRREMTAVSHVLDGMLGAGTKSPPEVTTMALEIIASHELQLSLKQWGVVQVMVEQGIKWGLARGQARPR